MTNKPAPDSDFFDGYRDGRNPDSPVPGDNRSHCYRHSFTIGRAEIAGDPIPAPVARKLADEAESQDAAQWGTQCN